MGSGGEAKTEGRRCRVVFCRISFDLRLREPRLLALQSLDDVVRRLARGPIEEADLLDIHLGRRRMGKTALACIKDGVRRSHDTIHANWRDAYRGAGLDFTSQGTELKKDRPSRIDDGRRTTAKKRLGQYCCFLGVAIERPADPRHLNMLFDEMHSTASVS